MTVPGREGGGGAAAGDTLTRSPIQHCRGGSETEKMLANAHSNVCNLRSDFVVKNGGIS